MLRNSTVVSAVVIAGLSARAAVTWISSRLRSSLRPEPSERPAGKASGPEYPLFFFAVTVPLSPLTG